MIQLGESKVKVSFRGKEIVALVIKPSHLAENWTRGSLYSVSPKAHFADGSKPKKVQSPKELIVEFDHPKPCSHSEYSKEYDLKKECFEFLFREGRYLEDDKLKGGLGS